MAHVTESVQLLNDIHQLMANWASFGNLFLTILCANQYLSLQVKWQERSANEGELYSDL